MMIIELTGPCKVRLELPPHNIFHLCNDVDQRMNEKPMYFVSL